MAYRSTARRKAALRKAQLASARKRRRRVTGALAGAAVVGAGAYAVSVSSRARSIHTTPTRMVRADIYRAKKKYRILRNKSPNRIMYPLYRIQKNAWYARKIAGNQLRRMVR